MVKWKKYNGALIPQNPPHIKVEMHKDIVSLKIKEEYAFFARWVSEFDRKNKSNFWYIINDKCLTLEDYSVNTRSKIRRGFKELVVRKIDKKEVLEYGYSVYISAFKRYKTINKPMLHNEFLAYIEDLDSSWEYWGVYNIKNNLLIAYSQNKVIYDQCNYSTIKFHSDYLKKYSSYVLYYSMNKYYLKERNLSYVNEGTRSILHKTNVQSFLIEKFKFRKAYCKLHIQYHPLIKIIIIILFPFRLLIIKSNNKLLHKIGVVLIQEELHKANKLE
tara:strand:+ start:565 stop:1386 length:822 start_codon:yes stop_codon:yes gene_type:complete